MSRRHARARAFSRATSTTTNEGSTARETVPLVRRRDSSAREDDGEDDVDVIIRDGDDSNSLARRRGNEETRAFDGNARRASIVDVARARRVDGREGGVVGWTRRRRTTARAGPTRDGGERDERDANEEANEEDATVERDLELTQGMVDAMNARKARKRRDGGAQQSTGGLEDVNPVALGRKSRAAFNQVFKRLTSLTSIPGQSGSVMDEGTLDAGVYDEELLSGSSVGEYETPNAKFTTVLVTGATGRVGRVLIRKLLLRGYTVKALVRRESDAEKLPGLVRVIVGDVGDKETIRTAAAGVNKVIYCASARRA